MFADQALIGVPAVDLPGVGADGKTPRVADQKVFPLRIQVFAGHDGIGAVGQFRPQVRIPVQHPRDHRGRFGKPGMCPEDFQIRALFEPGLDHGRVRMGMQDQALLGRDVQIFRHFRGFQIVGKIQGNLAEDLVAGDLLKKMQKANVDTALVSSTPDEGTMKLFNLSPERIVPGFRPYRTSADMARWYKNPDLLAYSKVRLAARRYKAFGEVILFMPENLDTPEMAEYLNIAAEQGLILHPHADAAVVEALFAKRPELKILWAHAGFSEPAPVVARMLDRYPNLWAELSYRADDIMAGADLDPEWRDLLIRHAGRFTIGSDTWQTDRWRVYQSLIEEHREWLGKLPPDVAAKIAHRNAESLLGKFPSKQ